MARKRLGENRPFMKKINALYEYMDNEGISLEYPGGNRLIIIDRLNHREYDLLDSDDGGSILEFPTGVEFKLSFESAE